MIKQIAKVTPHLMENYLIIALDSKWIKVFDGFPSFDVSVENEVLTIRSQKIPRRVDKK